MAYHKVIIALTKEEALKEADAFKRSLAIVQGPVSTYGPQELPGGQWEITITYYGFD